MKLVMFIGNDFIDAVPLCSEKLPIPGYLGNFKRDLKVKYSELIKTSPNPAEFLVVEVDKDEGVARAS
jgi:hypothetical protein